MGSMGMLGFGAEAGKEGTGPGRSDLCPPAREMPACLPACLAATHLTHLGAVRVLDADEEELERGSVGHDGRLVDRFG